MPCSFCTIHCGVCISFTIKAQGKLKTVTFLMNKTMSNLMSKLNNVFDDVI